MEIQSQLEEKTLEVFTLYRYLLLFDVVPAVAVTIASTVTVVNRNCYSAS